MKWVFTCLVLANLGYFYFHWEQQQDPPVPVVKRQAGESGTGIQLLSERQGRSDREREAATVLENPMQEDPGNRPPEPAPDEATGVTAQAGRSGADNAALATPARPAPAPENSDQCWRLGGFATLNGAQDIAERATALGTRVEIKAIDAPTGEYDYRVLIPPLNSMPEAFRRLRELKNRNIDSYVMAQGDNAQGISLGLFSSQAAAQRHQDDMTNLGYETRINPIARVSRAYWLFTRTGRFPEGLVLDAQARLDGLQASKTDCLN